MTEKKIGFTLLSFLLSCVPIQRARVAQVETFYQRYEVCNKGAEIDQVVKEILGTQNMIDIPGADWLKYREATAESAKSGQLVLVGHIFFTMSIYPLDRGLIYVEGEGRHIVFDKANKSELIASANYEIVDDGPRRLVDIIDDGYVIIRLKQQVVREFVHEKKRYSHAADSFVRVYIKQAAAGIISVDYARAHDVGIRSPGSYGDRIVVQTIGQLQFDAPRDGRKLIDLRDADTALLRSDYPAIIRRSSMEPQGGGPIIEWPPKPQCSK